MADSAFLSRLPVRGAVASSSGSSDAFKVPLLNADGKIDPSLIADKVIYEVANQAALLALPNLNVGDIALQADTKALLVLTALPSSIFSNWSSLGTGISYPVTRVAGKTGDITLNVSDISRLTEDLAGLQPAGDYALNSDPRLSNSRTPIAHASTHATGGTDPITPASIGAANRVHTHSVSQITDFPTIGTAAGLNYPAIGDATATQVVLGNDSRLAAVANKIDSSRIGQPNGIASLDISGKLPSSQFPAITAAKEISLRVNSGYIQWQYIGDSSWTNLVTLSSLQGSQGNPGNSVNLQVANGYIQWQHVGDNVWANLIAVSSLVGAKGNPGNSVNLQVANGYIQWQLVGDNVWTNLIPLSSITGPQGIPGTGVVFKGSISTRTALPQTGNTQGDAYIAADTTHFWIWSGSAWVDAGASIQGPQGIQGIPGTSVNLRVADGYIQWQHAGDSSWNNLIILSSLVGPAGNSSTIAIGNTTTGDADTSAVVTNVGTPSAAVLDFTIPRGPHGLDGAFELDSSGNLIPTNSSFVSWGLSEGTFHLDEDGNLTPTEIIVPPGNGGNASGYKLSADTTDDSSVVMSYGPGGSPDGLMNGQAIQFQVKILGHDRGFDTVSAWDISGSVQLTFDGNIVFPNGQTTVNREGAAWGNSANVQFSLNSSTYIPEITVTGISNTSINWAAVINIINTETAIQVPLTRGCKVFGADNYDSTAQVNDPTLCTFDNATSEMFIPITVTGSISSITVTAGGESIFPDFNASITDYAIKTNNSPGEYVQATVTINGAEQQIYGQVDKLLQIKSDAGIYYIRFLNSYVSSYAPMRNFYGPTADAPQGYFLYQGGNQYYIISDENGVPRWYILSPVYYPFSLHAGGDINRLACNVAAGGDNAVIALQYGAPYIRIVSPQLEGGTNEHEFRELAGPPNRKLNTISHIGSDGVSDDGFAIEEHDPQGNLVWEWHASDYFLPADNFSNVSYYTDLLHCNSIDVHPITGNLVVSSRHMSCLFEIDYSTKKINWVIQGAHPMSASFATFAKPSTLQQTKILTILGEPQGYHGTRGNHDARYHIDLVNTNNLIVSAYDDQTDMSLVARGVIYEVNVAAGTATCISSTFLTDQNGPDSCCGSYTVIKNPDGVISHAFGSANFSPKAIEYIGNIGSPSREKVYSFSPGSPWGEQYIYRTPKVSSGHFTPALLRTCWTQQTQPTAYNPPGGGGGVNLNSGLKAYWKFDNDGTGNISLTDSTSGALTLTNNNGVTIGSGKIGTGSASFSLNSGQQWLSLDNPPSWLNFGTGDFSFSFWVNSVGQNSAYPVFMSAGGPWEQDTVKICFNPGSTFVDLSQNPSVNITSITQLQDNQWYHAVITRASGDVKIYINSNLETTSTDASPMDFTRGGFVIGGGNWDGFNSQFNGLLDEIGIWNRAISQQEITELYSGGSGKTYPFTSVSNSLLADINAYWKFDNDGAGNVSLADSTPSALNFTNNNNVELGGGKNGGGSAVFNGSNFLQTPIITSGSSFTVSFWVKPYTTNGATITDCFGVYSIDINAGAPGAVGFSNSSDGATEVYSPAYSASIGDWSHVVGVVTPTAHMLYINGELKDTGGGLSPMNNIVSVGAFYYGGGVFNFFEGEVDEFGIWNRALTQGEISQLYAGGSGFSYPFKTLNTNLEAYWKFDNDNWSDSTGNGYSLTASNGTVGLTAGMAGNAAQFTVNNGWLENTSLALTGAWSISTWFNVQDDGQSKEFPSIWSTGITSGAVVVDVLGDNDSNNGWIYDGALGSNLGQFQQPGENTWNHSVVVNDSQNGLIWYLNGGAIGALDPADRDWTGLTIGSQGGQFAGPPNVTIDETGVWSRALTPAEVTSLYTGQVFPFDAQPVIQTGLVTWLDAQSSHSYAGSGVVWRDLTGNAVNGTLNGGVTFSTVVGAHAFTTDGTTGFIALGGVPNLGVSNQSFTIGVWVNPTTTGDGNIVGESASDPEQIGLWFMPPISSIGGEFDGIVYNANTTGLGMYSGSYTPNNWYYITLVYDQSTTSQFMYINGNLIGVQNILGTNMPDTAGNPNPYIFLGKDLNFAVYNAGWFAGSYGALHLYSNKALNSTEVLFNYNSTKGSYGL